MRKLFVSMLVALAAVPAVALAADTSGADAAGIQRVYPNGSDSALARTVSADKARAARLRLAGERRARARARARARHHAAAQAGPATPPVLQAIAACESGGDPHAVGGGGAYRGKYQFDQGTWASVGGSGDPAAAPEAEQDRRAAMLYARSGTSSWPVCGQ